MANFAKPENALKSADASPKSVLHPTNMELQQVEMEKVTKQGKPRGLTMEEEMEAQRWITMLSNPLLGDEEKTAYAGAVLALSKAVQEKVDEGLKKILWEKDELVWKKEQKRKKEERKEKQKKEEKKKKTTMK